MPAKSPTFRNRGESQHWSRMQAAYASRFNWAAKGKTKPSMVSKLTAEMADGDLVEYRKRTGSSK